MNYEEQIIESWKINAQSWINLIDENGIESRKLATNQAIVDAVCALNSHYILDLGCGEGWLTKILFEKGFDVTGVDAVTALIEKAIQNCKAKFVLASYDEISKKKILFPNKFDLIVINFALIGKESTELLINALPEYLASKGTLLIQTLHPYSRKKINDYQSGWKEGSWDGLKGDFTNPYQWYFRTEEDWLQLFEDAGFNQIKNYSVLHPLSNEFLSIIFQCKLI